MNQEHHQTRIKQLLDAGEKTASELKDACNATYPELFKALENLQFQGDVISNFQDKEGGALVYKLKTPPSFSDKVQDFFAIKRA